MKHAPPNLYLPPYFLKLLQERLNQRNNGRRRTTPTRYALDGLAAIMAQKLNARAITGLALVVVGSLACNVVLLIAVLLTWPISTAWYRRISTKAQALWMDCMAYALPTTTLHISGDMPSLQKFGDKKPVITISNHMVDADWFYLWMVCVANAIKNHENAAALVLL